MSNLMTWEEIEKAQLEISNTMKEIENKLCEENLEDKDMENLSYQLENIQKTVLQFREIKDDFFKDKI